MLCTTGICLHHTSNCSYYSYGFLLYEKEEKEDPDFDDLEREPFTKYNITDQKAIDNIYKNLEDIEKKINQNQTTEATIKLRLVSEYFTKEIGNSNELYLERMDQNTRLKTLYDQNYISHELNQLLTTIRKLGNKAVHELGDNDRFNKNGLLKLYRQLLEHVKDWTAVEQYESPSERSRNLDSTTTENSIQSNKEELVSIRYQCLKFDRVRWDYDDEYETVEGYNVQEILAIRQAEDDLWVIDHIDLAQELDVWGFTSKKGALYAAENYFEHLEKDYMKLDDLLADGQEYWNFIEGLHDQFVKDLESPSQRYET